MSRNKHHGSSLESFLAEEGVLEEAHYAATKKIIAFQIAQVMQERGLTKTAMAAQMNTTRAQLNRLLDPGYESVTLDTLKRAAKALGRSLRLELA